DSITISHNAAHWGDVFKRFTFILDSSHSKFLRVSTWIQADSMAGKYGSDRVEAYELVNIPLSVGAEGNLTSHVPVASNSPLLSSFWTDRSESIYPFPNHNETTISLLYIDSVALDGYLDIQLRP